MRPVLLSFCLAFITCCAHHSNRISRGDLQRLTKKHDPVVLVFGSLSTSGRTLGHPAIHFLHQSTAADPEYTLQSLNITNGDRFYAVLKKPEPLQNLDHFSVEVGSQETGFDKITYVRLPNDGKALAMYVGEINMSPAESRMAQGQKVVVKTDDDFQSATQELKRRYPGFDGEIAKVALLRKLSPPTAPLERIH
jgi:hypothetical protein